MAKDQDNTLLRTTYPRYDRTVLYLALLPIVLFPLFFLAVITAPTAVVLGIFGWRRAYNPVRNFQGWLFAGLLVAGIQCVLLFIGFVALILEAYQSFSGAQG